MSWRCWLAVIGALVIGRSAAQEGQPAALGKAALGKAAVAAYAANINAFPFYKCRYTITTAEAKSVEDALAGRFLNAISSDSRLLVDGSKELYEGLSAPVPPNPRNGVPMPGRPGVFEVPAAPVDSNRYLADGKREVNYTPQLRLLGLWPNDKGFRGLDNTPLALLSVGHRNRFGPDVLLTQPERYEMTSDGLEEIDGRPVVSVRFLFKQDNAVRRFSFDIGQGHLPTHINYSFGGRLRLQTFVTDVRESSGQRWFPRRIVVVTIRNQGDLYGVKELKVLEFDADNRPDAAEMTIPVPAGTQVCQQVDETPPKKPFFLKQDERINVDDLPNLFAMMDQAQVKPLMDTAVPRRASYGWLGWVGLAVATAGLLCLLWWRWRRRAAGATP